MDSDVQRPYTYIYIYMWKLILYSYNWSLCVSVYVYIYVCIFIYYGSCIFVWKQFAIVLLVKREIKNGAREREREKERDKGLVVCSLLWVSSLVRAGAGGVSFTLEF